MENDEWKMDNGKWSLRATPTKQLAASNLIVRTSIGVLTTRKAIYHCPFSIRHFSFNGLLIHRLDGMTQMKMDEKAYGSAL
jgi:hypothetical protein